MKFIMCGDLHLGEGKDSQYVQNIQLDFINQMCEYADKNRISVMIQSGDWFDVRAGVTQETLRFMRESVRPNLETVFDKIHVLVGNHDMHFKNQVMPNSVHENFFSDPLFKVYNEPTTISLGSILFDIIPWECKSNKDQIRKFISESNSEYSIGHWELMGFDFYSGIPSMGGEDKDFLSGYKIAFSGHYHTASKKGNVQYLGSPYTLTMNDCNDIRGFYVFDTDTEEVEFIPNKNMWHVKGNYSDLDLTDVPKFENKCVQLIIEKEDKDLNKFLTEMEKVCERITQKNLEDFKVGGTDDEGDEIEVKKVFQLFREAIEEMDLDEEHKLLTQKLASSLYTEAS
ncbi:endonuclease subunit [Aeromonas phage Aswh_1]|nr:endonuclease subunit [Aeromonas phage Aswh_1]